MVGFLTLLIEQRLIELFIAKRNEHWIKRRGGVEIGDKHYKWFIVLHTLFFISLIVESIVRKNLYIQLNSALFILFIILQIVSILEEHTSVLKSRGHLVLGLML